MPKPLDIDVEKRPWPIPNELRASIKGIVCINMIHISPWSCTKALFEESKNYIDLDISLILQTKILYNSMVRYESYLYTQFL